MKLSSSQIISLAVLVAITMIVVYILRQEISEMLFLGGK